MRRVVKPRGMSLAEVMMAISLLASVSLGALTLLPSAFAAQRRAEQQELATAAASEVLETFRQHPQQTSGQISIGATETYLYDVGVASVPPGVVDLRVSVACPGTRPVVLQTRLFSHVPPVQAGP